MGAVERGPKNRAPLLEKQKGEGGRERQGERGGREGERGESERERGKRGGGTGGGGRWGMGRRQEGRRNQGRQSLIYTKSISQFTNK